MGFARFCKIEMGVKLELELCKIGIGFFEIGNGWKRIGNRLSDIGIGL